MHYRAGGGALEQDFAIFALNADDQSPIGIVSISSDAFACNDPARFSVSDIDLVGSGSTSIRIETSQTGDIENLELQELNPPSGVFEGFLSLTDLGRPVMDDGVLVVEDGEVIEAVYHDETLDEFGKPLVARDQAVIDCIPPSLVEQDLVNVTESLARLIVETDEPSQVFVQYGLTCGSPNLQAVSLDFRQSHDLLMKDLSTCTPYFFTIRLIDRSRNAIDPAPTGQCFSFQTREPLSAFNESLEPGPQPGWTTEVTLGSTDWITSDSQYTRSPVHAWYIPNPSQTSDARLISPPLHIETGSKFTFWHTFELEAIGNVGLDGSVIEITTDNGITWQDLGHAIIEGGYNMEIEDLFTNPLGGRNAWSGGVVGEMDRVIVDLEDYEDQMVQIRFRLGADEAFSRKGWFIDDIELTTIQECIGELAQIAFDSPKFNCSEPLRFVLRDAGLAGSQVGPQGPFSISKVGQSGNPFTIQPESLNMIDPAGAWEGFLSVIDAPGGTDVIIQQALTLHDGEVLRLFYEDPDAVGVMQTVFSDNTLDCTLPGILNVSVVRLMHEGFTLLIQADEPVRVFVYFGTTQEQLDQELIRPPVIIDTDFYIGTDGLDPCTNYYYQLDVLDEAGNILSLDDQGQPFVLTTGFRAVFLDDIEPQPEDGWTSVSTTGEAS